MSWRVGRSVICVPLVHVGDERSTGPEANSVLPRTLDGKAAALRCLEGLLLYNAACPSNTKSSASPPGRPSTCSSFTKRPKASDQAREIVARQIEHAFLFLEAPVGRVTGYNVARITRAARQSLNIRAKPCKTKAFSFKTRRGNSRSRSDRDPGFGRGRGPRRLGRAGGRNRQGRVRAGGAAHRVIDGAEAARFVTRLGQRRSDVEEFTLLL